MPKYGNFVYSDPEFTWQKPVAPTGISFVKSEKLSDYQDSVFVGDCNTGNLYRFKLNSDRTRFVFETPELSDKVLNLGDPNDEIVFGSGFGCVTDIELGPDGLLYIVSLSEEKIYRLIPKTMAETTQEQKTDIDGGCLIATATYGTELSTQVQLLREIRDNEVFGTGSGAAFMTGFNQFYYSFSPTVADWERQQPMLKETIKTTITPMLSTLSLLSYAEINSEQEMLGYGVGIILLNIGIYFALPIFLIIKLKNRFFSRI